MDLIQILAQGNTFFRLMTGFSVTLYISLLTALFSVIIGLALGFVMNSKNTVLKIFSKVYLEFFRLLPQLVLLFVFYYGITSALGWDLDAQTSAIIVFTFWASAEMGDLIRSAIQNVSKEQIEAGKAVGLSKFAVARHIIIPNVIRTVIPQTVNLLTRIIKTSAIVPLIGVMDITKVGQAVIDLNRFKYPDGAFWIYLFIFVLYFVACYFLSLLSRLFEKKLMN
ncbi:MAG: amino acid ABC transporter permease [Candidatus Ancillula sp.]|jgi:polar amino acid transport system permease protein|nr:amino acid ABC transporter permease [Candidatus Ancillula sp.]